MSRTFHAEDSGYSLPPPSRQRPHGAAKSLLVRHQVAAAVGTAADFGAMIAGVQLLHLSPPIATLISAMVGGIVNFGASRLWAFDRTHSGSLGSQAWRYAIAMIGGAALNALVLAGILAVVSIPYPFARAFVAVVVSLLYTYPVHTRLVFRVTPESSWRARPSAFT